VFNVIPALSHSLECIRTCLSDFVLVVSKEQATHLKAKYLCQKAYENKSPSITMKKIAFCILLLFGMGCTEEISTKLTVSEQLDPQVSISILDKYFNEITIQQVGEYLNLVPVNIAPETKYTFRITSIDRNIILPEKYAFTSNEKENTAMNRYQEVKCDFPLGEYYAELIQIDGNKGTIISRKSFRVITGAVAKIQNEGIGVNLCKGFFGEKLYACFYNIAEINNCNQTTGGELDFCYADLKEMLKLVETQKSCPTSPPTKECVLDELQKVRCNKEGTDNITDCIENYVSAKLKNETDASCPQEGKEKIDCIMGLAKDANRAELCDPIRNIDSVFVDFCYNEVAIKTGDISLCRGPPKSIGGCRAMVNNDWTECQRITCDMSCPFEDLETQKDYCVEGTGILMRDASICEHVNNSDLKNFCLGLVNQDVLACEKITVSEYRESCKDQVTRPNQH